MPYAHSQIDLIHLYNKCLRDDLHKLGLKHTQIPDCDIGAYYHSVYARLISCQPRQVLYTPKFSCPTNHTAGLARLEKAFKDGNSIMPYQSKTISNLKTTDGLFFDWAIHHFHLGAPQYKSKFVERTGQVAFALVMRNAVLFLKIADHSSDPDVWTDIDMLEAVHDADPSLLRSYEVKGVAGNHITSQQRAAYRSVNGNAFVTLSNGKTYMSPGGGVVSNGLSLAAIRKDDQIQFSLSFLEKELNRDLRHTTSYFFKKISAHPARLDISLEKIGDLYLCKAIGGTNKLIVYPTSTLQNQRANESFYSQVRSLADSTYIYKTS